MAAPQSTLTHFDEKRVRVTFASIADAVISTDAHGQISFVNAVAEQLTGWPAAEATGQPLENVFQIVDELTRARIPNPARKVLQTGHIVRPANHTVLIARDGTERL